MACSVHARVCVCVCVCVCGGGEGNHRLSASAHTGPAHCAVLETGKYMCVCGGGGSTVGYLNALHRESSVVYSEAGCLDKLY